MTVGQFQQTNYTTQTGTSYPLAIDADWAVAARLIDNFAPHAQATPTMTVALDAGHLFNGTTLAEIAAQSTGTIAAPVSNPRIDRIVIDRLSGAVAVVTGAEAASPLPPAIPAGKAPVAQVLLQTSSTAIGNSMLTDERDLGALGLASGAYTTVGTAAGDIVQLDGSGRLPAVDGSQLTGVAAVPAGTILATGAPCGRLGASAPTGYLWFNGQAVSRTAYATLFGAICPSATATISIASPGVVTLNSHGLLAGDPVAFETSGALPTGVAADATYYVVNPTTNTFQVAAAQGGTAINTSGSQSGIQTCFYVPFSTLTSATFTVGDGRGRVLAGADALGGSAAGRLGSGQTGGITGPAVPGATGGEQGHALADSELPDNAWRGSGGGSSLYAGGAGGADVNSGTGGDPHNTVQPTLVTNYIIKT